MQNNTFRDWIDRSISELHKDVKKRIQLTKYLEYLEYFEADNQENRLVETTLTIKNVRTSKTSTTTTYKYRIILNADRADSRRQNHFGIEIHDENQRIGTFHRDVEENTLMHYRAMKGQNNDKHTLMRALIKRDKCNNIIVQQEYVFSVESI